MIVRVVIAVVGAIVVTGSLLLGMIAVTSIFENDSGERYFRITDILPKPDPGRPERPQAAARQPARTETELVTPDAVLPIEAPADVETDTPLLLAPETRLPDPAGD